MIAVKLQMEEDDFVPVGLDLGLAPGAEMGIGEEEKGEERHSSSDEFRPLGASIYDVRIRVGGVMEKWT